MNLLWYDENGIDVEDSVGIDEAGRGPLAGPVVAASVWISSPLFATLKNSDLIIRDSKKMTARQRKKVLDWIKLQSDETIRYSIASATVEEIDEINILQAALLAMKRSYYSLKFPVKRLLVDGNKAPRIKDVDVRTIVKGDDKVLSISLASIIAKEYRDNLMRKLALEYPHYGWETNVGYGSKKHMESILQQGITPHHRKTFAPINTFLSKKIIKNNYS
ncbi:MAG: ribonuclease HII [Holosporaceae bacterium]|jgi:ribonuclease HII|nr:ribonuclease HII [Holosporaceae bacterium]